MIRGISGAPVASTYPYADLTNSICLTHNFPPPLAYAIFWQESIQGQVNGKWDAATVVSGDGGHGIGQLTSSYPDNWDVPFTNITYAIEHFLIPAMQDWPSLEGEDLVRAVAATYNAGYGNAYQGHQQGDVDMYTTDHYAQRVLESYRIFSGQEK